MSVTSPIKQIRQYVRGLPEWHPLRTSMRAIKHSPRLFSDGILKDYLLYRFRKPLTIVVLGMHRSGTSFVTRAINLLGARVGNDLLGPSNSNPAGHWEHTYSLEINRRLLEMAGGRWDDPPNDVEAGLVSKFRMRLFLAKLHKGGEATAVWKDPRTLLTFKEWNDVMSNYKTVFVFRHPYSVYSSLNSRNNFNKEKSLKLWIHYNTKLIQIEEKEEDSIVIDFDSGFTGIKKSLKSLTECTNLDFRQEAIDFYDESIINSDYSKQIDGKLGEMYRELKSKAE